MRIISVLSLLLIVCACAKEEDALPAQGNKDVVARLVSGDKQSGCLFQELDSDIVIDIKNRDSTAYTDAHFKYTTEAGNGFVCGRSGTRPGEYRFQWLLSCRQGAQTASIAAYDARNQIINTFRLQATAAACMPWNRSCGLPFDSCTFVFPQVQKILNHPDKRQFLLTDSQHKLFVSADGGASWSDYYSFSIPEFGAFLNLQITEDGSFYLSSENGLFRSGDGKNWAKLIAHGVGHFYVLDNGRIIVDTSFNGRFVSNDGGATWSQAYSQPEFTKVIRIGNNTFCAINSEGHAAAYFSGDNGENWEPLSGTSTFFDILDIDYHDNVLYLLNKSPLYDRAILYKSGVDHWNWQEFAGISTVPHNASFGAILKFYQDDVYAYIDRHVYRISPSGETSSITDDVLHKITSISTLEISPGGNLLIGNQTGAWPHGGVYYRKLN